MSEKQITYRPDVLTRVADPDTGARVGHFFGFHSEAIGKPAAIVSLAEEQERLWKQRVIRDVLQTHFGSHGADFASRVVFEAFFNATKHPGASVIQTASWNKGLAPEIVEETATKGGSDLGPFTVLFWDNGRSMLGTMTQALSRGTTVRHPYSAELDKSYHVLFETNAGSIVDHGTLASTLPLAADTPDHLKLLSTIFPGVSSDPGTGTHAVSTSLEREDTRLAQRGMGLYVLTNMVVDVLGGEVAFRTDRFFMNVSPLGPNLAKQAGAKMLVKITELPDVIPPFLGNMLVVRLKSRPNE